MSKDATYKIEIDTLALSAFLEQIKEDVGDKIKDLERRVLRLETPVAPPPDSPPVDNLHVEEGCEQFGAVAPPLRKSNE